MKKLFFLIFLSTMCFACQQKQKMSREEYIIWMYKMDKYPIDSIEVLANGVNPYSLITPDYSEPISYDANSPNLPFDFREISGKSLDEVIDIYGNFDYLHNHVYYSKWDYDWVFAYPLNPILEDIPFPIILYECWWSPCENEDIKIVVFFVKDDTTLRAIYGEKFYNSRMPE